MIRMHVVTAEPGDFHAWLALAAQVEDLFGPMVEQEGFRSFLTKTLDQGTGVCVRDGENLAGALAFSGEAPTFHLSWLAVAESHRGRGVGRLLVEEALRRFVSGPGVVEVVTFGEGHPGAAARDFYTRLGFVAGEALPPGPEGGSRQMFRLHIDGHPSSRGNARCT